MKARTPRSTGILWALALGLGLAVGLMLAFAPRPAVEAQAANSGFIANLPRTVAAVERAPDDTIPIPSDADVPPDPIWPPAPPRDERLSWEGLWGAGGGAPVFAPAGGADGRAFGGNGLLATPPVPGSADLVVCMTAERVWGVLGAGETVTVAVDGTQMGAALADDLGFFWTTLYDASGDRPGLASGDVVTIYHDGVEAAGVTLRDISGQVDVVNDVISGTIGGSGFPISVTVYAAEGEPAMTSYSQTVSTDGAGNFSADFSGICDIVPWDDPTVAYADGGVEVHRDIYPTRLVALPSPLNLVLGWTTPGGVVTTTVYSETAETRDQVVGAADASGQYVLNPTILTSDTVFVELADGTVLSRTADVLTENVDPANDRITGLAPPGAVVHGLVDDLTPLGWRSVQTSTIANPSSGVYTVEFSGIADIMPGQWAGVHIADDEGDDLAVWKPSASVEVYQTYNEVLGYAAAPSSRPTQTWQVTLTLYTAASDSTSVYARAVEDLFGWYSFNPGNTDGLPDIAPGDVVTVESEGFAWQGVVAVMTMTVEADLENDRFTGTVETPSDRVELWGEYYQPQLYPVGGSFATLVTATSPFTAAPPGFDVYYNLSYDVGHRTADEYLELIHHNTDGFGVIMPANVVLATLPPPSTPFTITLYDGGGSEKAQFTGTSQEPTGSCGWLDFWNQGEQILPGDRVQVQGGSGFSQTLVIPDVFATGDPDTDVVSGHGPANTLLYVQVSDWHGWKARGFVPTDGSGDFVVAVDQLQELSPGAQASGDLLEREDDLGVEYFDENRMWVWFSGLWPEARVNYAHDWVGADYEANHTFWITVTEGNAGSHVRDTAAITSEHGRGWGGSGFETQDDDWSAQQRPDIWPGDKVELRSDDGYSNTIEVGWITGLVDVDADTVSGTIYAPGFAGLTLTVRCEVWEWGGGDTEVTGVAADGGSYLCDFPGWVDLRSGWNIAVMYIEPDDGDRVINVVSLPLIRAHYDMYGSDNNVWGHNAPPAATVVITVANPVSGFIAGGTTTVGGCDWCPPDQFHLDFPDGTIVAGNAVTVDFGGGLVESVTVLPVSAEADIDTDVVTITAPVGEQLFFNADGPDGHWDWWDDHNEPLVVGAGGYVTVEMSLEPYDIITGTRFNVHMIQNHDHGTHYSFWLPGPDMDVDKWSQGQPAAGEQFVYWIEYENEGEVAATNVVLTDTLPDSTTYVADSSGFPANVSDGVVTWSLGTVPPDFEADFVLVVAVDSGATEDLHNEVEIYTPYDSDADDNHREADDELQSTAEVDLWVDKGNQGDWPAPGYDFTYWIDYGNNEETASGIVTLTDTLPLSTSFVSWYTYDPLWYLVSAVGNQVVFTRPVVAGWEDGELYLTLHLSDTVEQGTTLENVVEIATPNETAELVDNVYTHTMEARSPYLDVGVSKGLNRGTTVAGHEIEYWVHCYNGSNTPAYNVLITDTLPTGTTFITSEIVVWQYGGWQDVPFPPTSTTPSQVVWDVGTLSAGEWHNIRVTLRIDSGVASGTVLTNAVEIAPTIIVTHTDDYAENDRDEVALTVHGPGPNLMVVKDGYWQGGPPWELYYDFQVYNAGTTDIESFTVTDTFPLSTTFDDGDAWWGYDFHDTDTQAIWEFEESIDTGDDTGGWLRVDVDPAVGQGRILTNVIEVTIPTGDVYTGDNTCTWVETTGPDLYVVKSAPSTEAAADELITFTIRYGNQAERWEDGTDESGTVYLTDTLPVGMQYVTSTLRWYGGDPYIEPGFVGDKLVFDIGSQYEYDWNEIYLTVKITGSGVLTNTVEIASSSATDVEPYYTNNASSFVVTVSGGDVYLPLVLRNY